MSHKFCPNNVRGGMWCKPSPLGPRPSISTHVHVHVHCTSEQNLVPSLPSELEPINVMSDRIKPRTILSRHIFLRVCLPLKYGY